MSSDGSKPLDTMQRIELAEGVEVELHPAGPMVRAMAYLIDYLWMCLLALGFLMFFAFLVAAFGLEIGYGAGALIGFAGYWGYQVFFEAGRRAATPGKRAMGLRVVAETGGRASTAAIMLRNLARVADVMPLVFLPIPYLPLPVPTYFAGFLVCLFTRRFQRMGDLVARTLVVYVQPSAAPFSRKVPTAPAIVPQPPPLALTREERSAIVRFEERAALWSPARREELAAHAAGLTRNTDTGGGSAGTSAHRVEQLSGIAVWLRDS